jgi:hypothetical protein
VNPVQNSAFIKNFLKKRSRKAFVGVKAPILFCIDEISKKKEKYYKLPSLVVNPGLAKIVGVWES